MKTTLVFTLIFFTLFTLLPHSDAVDTSKWKLPEGAKARLGKGAINEIVYSPDGTRLAVASSIGIWIYDAETGEELDMFTGHFDSVSSVAFSPDGNTIASGSVDNTIRLYDAHTGETIHILIGHGSDVTSVAFSPDGNTIASASQDGTIRLWDTRTTTHKQTQRLTGHIGAVNSVAFSPDGNTIVSAGPDNISRLWDAHTGRYLRTFTGHTDAVHSVAFSPDGNTIASCSPYENTIRLWDVQTGTEIRTLTGHKDRVLSVAFGPDGNTFASGSGDGAIHLWNIHKSAHKQTQTLTGHTRFASRVAFSPDRSTIAASQGNTIHLWDADTGTLLRTLRRHTSWILSVAFSPDGNTIASGSYGRFLGRYHYANVRLWDVNTGRLLQTFEGREGSVNSIAFSPDGNTIASGSRKTVSLWDANTGALLRTFTEHGSDVHSVAFSPDGNTIASGDSSGDLFLWDVHTGTPLQSFGRWLLGVNSVAFSPDGNTIASGHSRTTHTIHLWDTYNGEHKQTLTGPGGGIDRGPVYKVAFSPDGNTIASTGKDKTIRLWDAHTGEHKQTQTLTAHTDLVYSIVFGPDGNLLVSGNWKDTILLWDFTPDPIRNRADLNNDGTTNIQDLVIIASAMTAAQDDNIGALLDLAAGIAYFIGDVTREIKKFQEPFDLNGDGKINILDLVIVASELHGGDAAAPSIRSHQASGDLTAADVQQWLGQARQLDLKNPTMHRGIQVLQHILAVLKVEVPQDTALLPNYPNPFNPETWIPYQLATPADVTLTIYDIQGRVVRDLDLGHQRAGMYQSKSRAAYWDGRNAVGEPVASGVYFYTLTAGEFSATRKLLIRK